MSRATGWYDDPVDLHARVGEAGTMAELSRRTGVPETTLRSARDRHVTAGVWPQDPVHREFEAEDLSDIRSLLAARGMDADEWVIDGVTVNEWGVGAELSRQLKVRVRPAPTAALLKPADLKPVRLPKPRPRPRRDAKLVFIYGDDQRPNVDRGFERLQLEWIRDHQPDLILDLGDGADAPTISGHKTNPAMNWRLQECIDDTAQGLYAKRCAAPNAEMVLLPDNHFHARLRDYQLAQAAAVYGVHPAKVPGLVDDLEPLLSVSRMLRLDELGVKYMAPPGDTHYAEGHYEIVPGDLVAIHGYRTGMNLGKKFIDDYGCSVVYGHAHQQDVYVTDQKRRGVGVRRRLWALGVGCGANIHGGGGFAPGADWQNCALTVSVFPDGRWTWDYMNYEHGALTWRDQRYDLEAV